MKTPKHRPDAPLTKEHLELACKWARGLTVKPLAYARYEQSRWLLALPCGTTYCLHGAAHVLARGCETGVGPMPGDYADCPRIAVSLLYSTRAPLSMIEDALNAPKSPRSALKWFRGYCRNNNLDTEAYRKLLVTVRAHGFGFSIEQELELFSTQAHFARRPAWLDARPYPY